MLKCHGLPMRILKWLPQTVDISITDPFFYHKKCWLDGKHCVFLLFVIVVQGGKKWTELVPSIDLIRQFNIKSDLGGLFGVWVPQSFKSSLEHLKLIKTAIVFVLKSASCLTNLGKSCQVAFDCNPKSLRIRPHRQLLVDPVVDETSPLGRYACRLLYQVVEEARANEVEKASKQLHEKCRVYWTWVQYIQDLTKLLDYWVSLKTIKEYSASLEINQHNK